MQRAKRILKILGVNAAILFVGVVVIELVFGGWLNPRTFNRLNILRDVHLKYNVSAIYDDPDPIINYTRDEFGLRGSHTTPADIDILTVGGSTTDQRYIRDGETWQDVLQQRFAAAGLSVVVANAGVDGQSTYGHIKNFQWWFPDVPGLAPEFILFYIGLNDFYIDAGRRYDDLVGGGGGFDLRRKIKENSALWHLLRTGRAMWNATVVMKIGHRSVDFTKLRWTRQALHEDYTFMQPRLDGYAERLRILIDMTRGFGAEPILVSQPSRRYRVTGDGIEGLSDVTSYEGRTINGVDHYRMMRKLDGVTEAVALERSVLFIDLAGNFDGRDGDFYDGAHMTPSGAEKVGNLMYEALSRVLTADDSGALHSGAGETTR